MKIYQYSLFENSSKIDFDIPFTPDVIFLFVSPSFAEKDKFLSALQAKFPETIMVGSASFDNSGIDNPYKKKVEFTAVKMESARVKAEFISMDEVYTSYEAGDLLAEKLKDDNLKHIFLFSDGYNVRGGDLLNGIRYSILDNISITGNISLPHDSSQGFVIANGAIVKDCVLGLAIYGGQEDYAAGIIDRFEKIGPDVLNRESLEQILLEMEENPEPQFS